MIGGMTALEKDVIPYGLAMGDRGYLAGLNLVGLRRRGFDRDATATLRAAFKALFESEGELTDRVARLRQAHGDQPVVAELLDFLSDSDRKILRPRSGHDG
jgi:UDP-N-acetylglucosamine acyltransferase